MIIFIRLEAVFSLERVPRRQLFARCLERQINIYTANGDLIAQYNGKIDLQENDGGYVMFDFEGKRYTYYNCFVECIANIEDILGEDK